MPQFHVVPTPTGRNKWVTQRHTLLQFTACTPLKIQVFEDCLALKMKRHDGPSKRRKLLAQQNWPESSPPPPQAQTQVSYERHVALLKVTSCCGSTCQYEQNVNHRYQPKYSAAVGRASYKRSSSSCLLWLRQTDRQRKAGRYNKI